MTRRADFSRVFAGAVFEFTGRASQSLAGALITCTVKRYRTDPDPGVAQVSTTGGGITLDPLDDTRYTVRFGSIASALWPIAELWYDVQVEPVGEVVRAVQHGWLRVRRRITLTRSAEWTIGAPLLTSTSVYFAASAEAST